MRWARGLDISLQETAVVLVHILLFLLMSTRRALAVENHPPLARVRAVLPARIHVDEVHRDVEKLQDPLQVLRRIKLEYAVVYEHRDIIIVRSLDKVPILNHLNRREVVRLNDDREVPIRDELVV